MGLLDGWPEAAAAFNFAPRHLGQKQAFESGRPARGGYSAHQHLPSGLHVIAEPHCGQRVSMATIVSHVSHKNAIAKIGAIRRALPFTRSPVR
jgi:hypothetical protein